MWRSWRIPILSATRRDAVFPWQIRRGRVSTPNDRKNEPRRHGLLGPIRQWIESVIDTLKGQLSLERHDAHTVEGLAVRVAQRLLALAACLWHNAQIHQPGRHLTPYDH